MGLFWSSTNQVTNFGPFVIERMIGPAIMVGVNKHGELIKIRDQYYKLIDAHRVGSRLEYTFESNNNLTLEKLNEKSQFGPNKLFYKLSSNGTVQSGEMILPYKTILLNSDNLDMIYKLQNEDNKN